MFERLTTWEIADRLKNDDNAAWTSSGSYALAEYLERFEEDTGEEMELDIVAIRCEFSEHANATAAAKELLTEDERQEITEDCTDEDEEEAAFLEYFRERETVIEHDDGIIIQSY